MKDLLKALFIASLVTMLIIVTVTTAIYIIKRPDIIKGTIEVDDERITCMDTKYFVYVKDHFIRCQSYDGEKYLVTGKFKFIKEKDNDIRSKGN